MALSKTQGIDDDENSWNVNGVGGGRGSSIWNRWDNSAGRLLGWWVIKRRMMEILKNGQIAGCVWQETKVGVQCSAVSNPSEMEQGGFCKFGGGGGGWVQLATEWRSKAEPNRVE